MSTQIKYRRQVSGALIASLALLMLPIQAGAQKLQLKAESSEISITGTSTLHDWEITSESQRGSLVLDMEAADASSLTNLQLAVRVKGLKSGKENMDRNTYKALRADEFTDILFRCNRVVTTRAVGAGTSGTQVVLHGDLTITGQTRSVAIPCELTREGKHIRLKGTYPMQMTQFGIEPPTALLGTIKTGDQIEIVFNTLWAQ